jgi:diadenosine tetraphosphate (Ap4A) HIT family hydrolase
VFVLNERLEADSVPVGTRAGCLVRLFHDARYPWLLVIPAMGRFREWWELVPEQRAAVDEVLADCARVLAALPGVEKTNLASLGNLVPQLHWHVVGRRPGDPAWPGPVWGHGTPQPYDPGEQTTLIAHLRPELGLPPQPAGSDQPKLLCSKQNVSKKTVD